MSGWLIALIIAGAVIVIFSVIVAVAHERLTIRRSVTINAFAFVEAQMNQKHRLLEELLEVTSKDAATVLGGALKGARAAASTAAETPQDGQAVRAARTTQAELTAAAATAFEGAGEAASGLSERFEEVEEHLSFATATFDWAVEAYNRSRRRLPGRGFARLFGFRVAGTWGAPGSGVGHGG